MTTGTGIVISMIVCVAMPLLILIAIMLRERPQKPHPDQEWRRMAIDRWLRDYRKDHQDTLIRVRPAWEVEITTERGFVFQSVARDVQSPREIAHLAVTCLRRAEPTTDPQLVGCEHSAQSWYIEDGKKGCSECDALTGPATSRNHTLTTQIRDAAIRAQMPDHV